MIKQKTTFLAFFVLLLAGCPRLKAAVSKNYGFLRSVFVIKLAIYYHMFYRREIWFAAVSFAMFSYEFRPVKVFNCYMFSGHLKPDVNVCV